MNVIAKMIYRHRVTLSNYMSAYKDGHIDVVALNYSTGKLPNLSQEKMIILLETRSTKVPADVGFTASHNWILALIVEFVKKEWDVPYSLCGMSGLLHRLGLSYTCSTYTPEKVATDKQ